MRGAESAWDSTGDRAQGGFTSRRERRGGCDPGLAADLSKLMSVFALFCGGGASGALALRVLALHASCLIYPP